MCVCVLMGDLMGVGGLKFSGKSDRKLSNSLKEIATSFSFTSRQKTNFQLPKGSLCVCVCVCAFLFTLQLKSYLIANSF